MLRDARMSVVMYERTVDFAVTLAFSVSVYLITGHRCQPVSHPPLCQRLPANKQGIGQNASSKCALVAVHFAFAVRTKAGHSS